MLGLPPIFIFSGKTLQENARAILHCRVEARRAYPEPILLVQIGVTSTNGQELASSR